jgi:hypothetical protein
MTVNITKCRIRDNAGINSPNLALIYSGDCLEDLTRACLLREARKNPSLVKDASRYFSDIEDAMIISATPVQRSRTVIDVANNQMAEFIYEENNSRKERTL